MCVRKEERIKHNNDGVDSVNMAKHHQKRKNIAPKPYVPKKKDRESHEHELHPSPLGQGSMQVV
jgi:hypothetical protein